MKKNHIITSVFLFFLHSNIYAEILHDAQIFIYDPYKKIQADICFDIANRISFEGDKIKQIIGDEEQYQLFQDFSGGHIFIIPKNSKTSTIHISIISQRNKAQEIIMKVLKNCHKNIIVIKE